MATPGQFALSRRRAVWRRTHERVCSLPLHRLSLYRLSLYRIDTSRSQSATQTDS